MSLLRKILATLRLWDPWPCPLCSQPTGMDRPWRASPYEQIQVGMWHLKQECPIILAPPRLSRSTADL